jgi:ribosomal protein S6
MKTELELLKEWIAEQREAYTITHFESDEKKLEAIERMLTLNEVMLQISIFETLTANTVIDSWNTKDNNAEYMHISPEQRAMFDEVFENRTAK